MKLEDFKLQKGDRLDTLSKKYISVTKGGNRRELYNQWKLYLYRIFQTKK